MIGGWAWPRRFGGASPLWRPAGHAARRVLRWAAAGSLSTVGLVLCLIEPSTLELWRVLVWTFLVLVLPSWLLVVLLSGLLSVGAWSVRSNVVAAGTSAVSPALVCLGVGVDRIGVSLMAAGGAAAVWITWTLRWRSRALDRA